jgi:uridine kinase
MRSDSKPESVFFIGVTGGSGAGKTFFASHLREAFGREFSQIISQDSYYCDQSQKFDCEGGAVNFDIPESIDFNLLHQHLVQLQQGLAVQVPIYDFCSHQRLSQTLRIFPTDIMIVEGGLILTQPEIRDILTEVVFLDIREELRLERLIKRDILERGREREGVLKRFYAHVRPMHERYIEPNKSFASYLVEDERNILKVIENLVENLGVDS